MARHARLCPRCGRKRSFPKFQFAAFVLLQVSIVTLYLNRQPHTIQWVGDQATDQQASSNLPTIGWYYFDTHDELIDDTTHHARLISDSDHGVKDGVATGTLELRRSKRYGSNIIIFVARRPYDALDERCMLRMKFDDGDVMVFRAAADIQGMSARLVLDGYDRFTGAIAGSKALSVDAALAHGSERTMHFTVAGLHW